MRLVALGLSRPSARPDNRFFAPIARVGHGPINTVLNPKPPRCVLHGGGDVVLNLQRINVQSIERLPIQLQLCLCTPRRGCPPWLICANTDGRKPMASTDVMKTRAMGGRGLLMLFGFGPCRATHLGCTEIHKYRSKSANSVPTKTEFPSLSTTMIVLSKSQLW